MVATIIPWCISQGLQRNRANGMYVYVVCICMYILCMYVDCEIHLKELAYMMAEAGKSKIGRLEIQGRAAVRDQRQSAGRIPPPRGRSVLLY